MNYERGEDRRKKREHFSARSFLFVFYSWGKKESISMSIKKRRLRGCDDGALCKGYRTQIIEEIAY